MASAKKLEELIVWQLACRVRDRIGVLIEKGLARRDADYRDQILRSSRSAPANIAEGFGYFNKPREFARYLRIARASVIETRNHIHEGASKYLSGADADRLLRLVARTMSGIASLLRYLESLPADFEFPGTSRTPVESQEPLEPLEPPEPLEPLEPPEA